MIRLLMFMVCFFTTHAWREIAHRGTHCYCLRCGLWRQDTTIHVNESVNIAKGYIQVDSGQRRNTSRWVMPTNITAKTMVYCDKCGWFAHFMESNAAKCPMCDDDHLHRIPEGRLLVACMVCRGVIKFVDGRGQTGVSHGGHKTCVEEKYGIDLTGRVPS